MNSNGVVHISEAATLGLHAMIVLACDPERRLTVKDLALALGASANHLAKVMGSLTRARLVGSVRGPAGGFTLARGAADICLLEVYEAIDGALRPHNCLLGERRCTGTCMLGDLVKDTNAAFVRRLATTRLDSLARTWRTKRAAAGRKRDVGAGRGESAKRGRSVSVAARVTRR